MCDRRDLHPLKLPIIFELVNASVDDRIVEALVELGINDLGEVEATGRRKEPAHLDGQRIFRTQRAKDLGSLGQALRLLSIGIRAEVVCRESGTVFKPLHVKIIVSLELRAEGAQTLLLLFKDAHLFLLRAGEEVQTENRNLGMMIAVLDQGEDVAFIHAELCAGRQSKEHRHGLSGAESFLADQPVVARAFGCQNADSVTDRTSDVFRAFVDTGIDHFLHVDTGALAERELARRAYLDPVKHVRKRPEQERVRLDGKAQSDPRPEGLANLFGAALEETRVEAVGRRRYLLSDRGNVHLFVLLALDHGPDRACGVEVLRDKVHGRDLDVKGVVDLGNERHDVKGLQHAARYKGGLSGKVYVGAQVFQNFH